jgi:hypothetical protein
MATQTTSPAQTSTTRLLCRTLQANGIFASVSGIALIAGAVPITSFLGLSSPLILVVVGALVLLYVASLFVAAARRTIDRQTGFLYATIDGAWVLLLTSWVPFTAAGKWSVGLAAFIVSAFAGLQSYGAWRAR